MRIEIEKLSERERERESKKRKKRRVGQLNMEDTRHVMYTLRSFVPKN